MIRTILAVGALALAPPATLAGTHTETFTTTTYKDAANTTADWNTSAGELRLFSFAVSELGNYDSPGVCLAAAVSGDLAFAGDAGTGLRVLDISDPSSPMVIGTVAPPLTCYDIAVNGNLVFIADGGNGLVIVDVSNPAAPVVIGSLVTSDARGVAVFGSHVLVADNLSGLLVVDVSNLGSPVLRGSYDTPGEALGVDTSGLRGFVADGSAGLHVFDLSDPDTLVVLGSYDTAGNAQGVAMHRLVAFVADGASGLLAIDTNSPTSPALLGSFDTPGNAEDAFVAGDRAFVADGASGLQVVDITDPAAMTLVSAHDTPGTAHRLDVDGTHAFVADHGRFRVIEIASQALTERADFGAEQVIIDVCASGDIAVLAGVTSTDLVDISDIANPVVVGSIPAYFTGAAGASGNLLALSHTFGGGALEVIDIGDPTAPLSMGYAVDVPALDMVVAGPLVYAVTNTALKIVNISDPANPFTLGSTNVTGALALDVSGDRGFVVWINGVAIYDVSNPTLPFLIGGLSLPGVADVAVAGDLAYVTYSYGYPFVEGLQIVDVSDPLNPTVVGDLNNVAVPGREFERIQVSGNHALYTMSGSGGGVFLVDVTDPAQPSMVTSRAGSDRSIALSGEYAFVTHTAGGLEVLQLFQEEVSPGVGTGQSLEVDGSDASIVRVRLTTSQSSGVSWLASADGGTNWTSCVADGATWHRLTPVNDDLRWRSTHAWSPGSNPTVSDLQLEWLTAHSTVVTIGDLPGDQGGWVRLSFERSGYDFADEASTPVTNYGVWRRVDDAALAASPGASPAHATAIDPMVADAFRGMPLVTHGGRVFLQAGPEPLAGGFPPGTWELVQNVPALQKHTYTAAIPTAADSTQQGTSYTVLVITAHTATPSLWFASAPDSGYSVDNIAPAVPANFVVAYNTGNGNTLSWGESPDADFQYFRVYRASDPNFTPSPGTLAHETIVNGWADPDHDGGSVYYKVTAIDYAGNESAPTAGGTTTGVGNPGLPESFALHPNVPNPFNPSTLIRYDVPAGGAEVSLRVYTVSGALVRRLVEGHQPAGRKSVAWDGRDDAGRPLASGVYFYRLTAPGYTKTHKMVLMK